MATIPTLISVEEYLSTGYHPDCDYLDGQLAERNGGEYPHSRLQSLMSAWFVNHEAEWSIETLTEQRMYISSSRYRVADVLLLRADAPQEKVTTTAPLLCIEILSPEQRIRRETRILADYAQMGIAQSWLINPLRREAFVHDATGLHPTDSDRLELPGTPIYFILSDLFAALDKRQ